MSAAARLRAHDVCCNKGELAVQNLSTSERDMCTFYDLTHEKALSGGAYQSTLDGRALLLLLLFLVFSLDLFLHLQIETRCELRAATNPRAVFEKDEWRGRDQE